MKVLITQIGNVSAEGVSFRTNHPASINGGIRADQFFVSWDRIGKALFGEQYSDANTVSELDKERGVNDE